MEQKRHRPQLSSPVATERQRRADRLTVDLPIGTLTALKIHAAQNQTTIRDVVTALIQKEVAP
jgi:hypothetical protein